MLLPLGVKSLTVSHRLTVNESGGLGGVILLQGGEFWLGYLPEPVSEEGHVGLVLEHVAPLGQRKHGLYLAHLHARALVEEPAVLDAGLADLGDLAWLVDGGVAGVGLRQGLEVVGVVLVAAGLDLQVVPLLLPVLVLGGNVKPAAMEDGVLALLLHD